MFGIVWTDNDNFEFDVDALEERPRCEADHRDGGVCQRLLNADGRCPGEGDHA